MFRVRFDASAVRGDLLRIQMSLSVHISCKGGWEGENGLAPSSPVTRVAHLRPCSLPPAPPPPIKKKMHKNCF